MKRCCRIIAVLILSGISVSNVCARTEVFSDDTVASAPIKVRRQNWRIGLHNGVSYLWTSLDKAQTQLISDGADPDDVDDFFKKFRRGYHFSADAYKIFANIWGVGVKYSVMASVAEQYMRFEAPDGLNLLHTDITNREYVNFIGGSFYAQHWFARAERLYVNANISLGCAFYRNEFETDFENYYFRVNRLDKGKTIGGGAEIALEYFPTPGISLACGVGCFLARFDRLSVTRGGITETVDLTGEDRRNVSRFDFSVGIRFYFK